MTELVVIAMLGFSTSMVGGMLGVGGAVLLIPLFLVVPPLLGFPALEMRIVSGITSMQILASSIFGSVLHRRRGAFDQRVVFSIGLPLVGASFIGALLSGMMSSKLLEGVFALMAMSSAILLMRSRKSSDNETFEVPLGRAIAVGTSVGLVGGMVGAAGGFILSPLMVGFLGIPLRVTIGSTLGIVSISAFATVLGKAINGLIPFHLAIAAIIGSLPGMWFGVRISHTVKVSTLRRMLTALIFAIGCYMLVRVSLGM